MNNQPTPVNAEEIKVGDSYLYRASKESQFEECTVRGVSETHWGDSPENASNSSGSVIVRVGGQDLSVDVQKLFQLP